MGVKHNGRICVMFLHFNISTFSHSSSLMFPSLVVTSPLSPSFVLFHLTSFPLDVLHAWHTISLFFILKPCTPWQSQWWKSNIASKFLSHSSKLFLHINNSLWYLFRLIQHKCPTFSSPMYQDPMYSSMKRVMNRS